MVTDCFLKRPKQAKGKYLGTDTANANMATGTMTTEEEREDPPVGDVGGNNVFNVRPTLH